MKQLIIIVICFMLALAANAQLIRDEWGEVIPFSVCDKYKNLIDTSKIKTRLYKSYNNDSLFTFYNKKFDFNLNSPIKVGAMIIDSTIINLKNNATIYEIDEGTIWVLSLKSYSAEGFDIQFNNIIIPTNGYLCMYSNDGQTPNLFLKEDLLNTQFSEITLGSQSYIEYFEPINTIEKGSIYITQIFYRFSNPLKKKDNSTDTGSNINLKSGGHGTAVNQCQRNVVCKIVYSMA